ncbi:MAG TPA: hypothetical protein VHA52_13635, partial [Candidatus Babeliaceae bacterium]|nr:hypothetical protein [Candidatus Babeliaceae bacterium]
ISEVNGTTVKTLDELRQALKKSLQTSYLTIKTSESVFGVFDIYGILEKEKALSKIYFYPISTTVKELIEKMQKKDEAQKKA